MNTKSHHKIDPRGRGAALLICLLGLLLILSACSDSEEEGPGLEVLLYTPSNAELNPIPADLQQLRFSAVNTNNRSLLQSKTVGLGNGSADLSGIPYGENLQMVVEGLDSLGSVIIRGRSTPFSFDPETDARRVPILMMEVESFSPAATLGLAPDGGLTVRPVAFQVPQSRAGHTATRLSNDRILFAGGAVLSTGAGIDFPWLPGGVTLQKVIGTVELYDPATGTFLELPPMRFQRAFHTTTLLDDGRILVTGGIGIIEKDGGGQTIETIRPAEIFNPETQTWSIIASTSAPTKARAWHTATQRKSDGKVILVGGRSIVNDEVEVLSSAEVFNPDELSFEKDENNGLIALNHARAEHSAVLSAVGPGRGADILILGGRNGSEVLNSVETLQSINNGNRLQATENLPKLRNARYAHSSIRVTPEDGNLILIMGGIGEEGALREVEVLDLKTAQTTVTGMLAEARSHMQALELPQTQDVLVMGGSNADGTPMNSAESLDYDIQTGQYTSRAIDFSMETGRSNFTAVMLSNGLVLIAGGTGNEGNEVSSVDSVELFNPDDGSPVNLNNSPGVSDGEGSGDGGGDDFLGGGDDEFLE